MTDPATASLSELFTAGTRLCPDFTPDALANAAASIRGALADLTPLECVQAATFFLMIELGNCWPEEPS